MRTPSFWFTPADKPAWQARVLQPFGAVYAALTARRLRRAATIEPNIPVICVGNINAGGTGKTPTAIAIAQWLLEQGETPVFVSRGYGGTEQGPVVVDPTSHTADHVGDEPLLLSAFAPTIVAKSRGQGVAMAQNMKASIVILDDGFQNPDVKKDIKIVVVDAVKGFGNGRCIPAGPLREPTHVGLKRADILISIGGHKAQKRFTQQVPPFSGTHIQAELKPLPTGMPWTDIPVLAFAGIGHPEKFFDTVRSMGANIIHAEALADHQPLTDALMARLEADAKRFNAQLVTTEKDAVRLPDTFRQKVLTVPVRLSLNDWAMFDALVGKAIAKKKAR